MSLVSIDVYWKFSVLRIYKSFPLGIKKILNEKIKKSSLKIILNFTSLKFINTLGWASIHPAPLEMQVNYGTHFALTVRADTALLDIVPFALLHHFFSTQSFRFPLSPCPLDGGMPQKRNSGPFHYLKYLHTFSCFVLPSSFLDNFLYMYMHAHTQTQVLHISSEDV